MNKANNISAAACMFFVMIMYVFIDRLMFDATKLDDFLDMTNN